MSGMGIDEFLSHQPGGSSGGKIVRWTKRTPPMLRWWLHCEAFIRPLWRHGWLRVVEIDKDGDKETHVWSGHFTCWEDDKVVSEQYQRDRDGGRVKPPRICPMCLFLEHLRLKVDAGEIDWLAPVFVFDAPDDDEPTVLVAAAMYNGIPRELDDDQKAELKEAGVRRSESWKSNTMAKCSYVLVGVDDDDVDSGVQTIVENTLTGDKLRAEIRKKTKRTKGKAGNPLKTPYPFLLEYMPEEREIQKKYEVTALDDDPTEQILALIKETEPPSTDGICKPGDPALLRSVMEDHLVEDLQGMFDFDAIFGPSEKESDYDDQDDEPESEPPPAPKKATKKAATKAAKKPKPAPVKEEPKKRRRKRAEPKPKGPQPYDGDDGLPCESDGCGFMMAPDWAKCPACGAEYEIETEDEDSGKA